MLYVMKKQQALSRLIGDRGLAKIRLATRPLPYLPGLGYKSLATTDFGHFRQARWDRIELQRIYPTRL